MESVVKILRDSYINELMIRRQNGMIKVVTGMRRAGKSYLLLKLFHEKLIEEGVPEDHIFLSFRNVLPCLYQHPHRNLVVSRINSPQLC